MINTRFPTQGPSYPHSYGCVPVNTIGKEPKEDKKTIMQTESGMRSVSQKRVQLQALRYLLLQVMRISNKAEWELSKVL